MKEIGTIDYNAAKAGGAFQASSATKRVFIGFDEATKQHMEVIIYAFVSNETYDTDKVWQVGTVRETRTYSGITFEPGYAPGASTRKRDALVAARQYIRNLDPKLIEGYSK